MRRVLAASLALLVGGCEAPGTAPLPPPAPSNVVIGAVSPASGGSVVVPAELPYIVPGGVALLPGSSLISVGLTVTVTQAVPQRAQLNVYLLTGGTTTEYCGQNDPDSPTWASLPAGFTTSYAVTGFRVYRLPCEVTGIRAMLHTRNSGSLIPPLPNETVAEATAAARFTIRRQE